MSPKRLPKEKPKRIWVPNPIAPMFPVPPSGATARIEKKGDHWWHVTFSTGGGWDYSTELGALRGVKLWHETGRIG